MQLSFLTQWFNNDVLKALAWTFAHSLWQGLLAALLAAVIISATRRTTAKLRYNLLGTVLILFLTAAFITFFIQIQHQEQITASALQTATTIAGSNAIDSNASAIMPEGFIANLTNWFNNNTDLILLAWVLFFSLNCLKLFTGLVSVNRLRNYKTHPVTGEWKIKLDQLRNSIGIRHSVNLLQSELIKVPVALGYLKPVILLPFGLLTNIPAEQVETILLHELGHIRRRDYLVNFIQHFVEAIFFFNPGMIWISSLLRQEREACCDDIVIANSNQKLNYLNALVAFQEYSLNHTPYAMAISSKRQYLLNRVKRIVMNENKKLNIFEKAALLAGIFLFSAFTYTSQEKETTAIPVTAPVLQLTNMQQSTGSPEEKILIIPASPTVKRQKKKITPSYKPVTDTVPAKKDTAVRIIAGNKILSTGMDRAKADTNANLVLQQIIQIKEQIGKTKESIGLKKEQLNAINIKEKETEKEKIMEQIERERGEIEGKRGELERKRNQYEQLKKQEAKEKSKDNALSTKLFEHKITDDDRQTVKKTRPAFVYEKIASLKLNEVKLEQKEIVSIKKQNEVIVKKPALFTSKKSTLFSPKKSTLFEQKTPPSPPKSLPPLETKVRPVKPVQI